jgi:putative ABC transport system permease protein
VSAVIGRAGSTELPVGPLLAVTLLVLVAGAALVAEAGSLGLGREIVVAAVRAAVQLAAVSLVIVVALRSHGWTLMFVLLMVVIAAVTAGRRVSGTVRGAPWALAPIVGGVGPVLAVVLGTTLVPLRPVVVLPVAGILIGGAMTSTTLAGRQALRELRIRRGEYEAGLAIGLAPRTAALEVCRPPAGQALIPAIDQTRTVGLVTLPGAFVGAILGGATPIQAGALQLLVFVGLLAAHSIAVLVTAELVAAGRFRESR